MIQRKQTIFLLLALVAIVLSFFFPILGVDGAVGQEDLLFNLKAVGSGVSGNIGLFIVMVVAFLLDGVAIFAYKQRGKQMKLILCGLLLMLVWYALLAIGLDWSNLRLYHWHVSCVLPLVAIILNLMAYKGVKSDDELVKSMDRIR